MPYGIVAALLLGIVLTKRNKAMKPKGNPNPGSSRDKEDFPGYPHYGKTGDIYSNEKEEQNVDPERPDREKSSGNEPEDKADVESESDLGYDDLGLKDEYLDANEQAAGGRTDGDELDVPGAELDDDQEALGSEDEENNYYSLGGDNHDDDSREPDTYSGR